MRTFLRLLGQDAVVVVVLHGQLLDDDVSLFDWRLAE